MGGEAKASIAAAVTAAVLPAPLPSDSDLDINLDDQTSPPPSTPCVWERRLVVLTPYGWGTLRSYRAEDGMLEIRLEWNAICYIRPTDILDRYVFIIMHVLKFLQGFLPVNPVFFPSLLPSLPPSLLRSVAPLGACVLTTAGAGVLVHFRKKGHVHVVRLWNRIGCDGTVRGPLSPFLYPSICPFLPPSFGSYFPPGDSATSISRTCINILPCGCVTSSIYFLSLFYTR